MSVETKQQTKVSKPSIPNTKMRDFIDEKGCNKPFDEFIEKLETKDIKKAKEYEKLLEKGVHKTHPQESKFVQELVDGKSNVKTENKKKTVETPLTEQEIAEYKAFMEQVKPAYSEYKQILKTIKKSKTKFTKHSVVILTKFIEKFITDIVKACLLLCDKNHKTVKKEFLYSKTLESEWFYPYLVATSFQVDKVKYLAELEWNTKSKSIYDALAKKVVESEEFVKDFDEKTLKKIEAKLSNLTIKSSTKQEDVEIETVTEKTSSLLGPFIKNTLRVVKEEMLADKTDKPKLPTLKKFKEYLEEITMELMRLIANNLTLILKAIDKNNVNNALIENSIDLVIANSFVAQTITIERVSVLDKDHKKVLYNEAKGKTEPGKKITPDYSECKQVEEFQVTKQFHMNDVNVSSVLDIESLTKKGNSS